MKATEFMKRFEKGQKESDEADRGQQPEEDHSLQGQAKERAEHPEKMNAGTAHDWEDRERWQNELDRLDREGPGKSQK